MLSNSSASRIDGSLANFRSNGLQNKALNPEQVLIFIRNVQQICSLKCANVCAKKLGGRPDYKIMALISDRQNSEDLFRRFCVPMLLGSAICIRWCLLRRYGGRPFGAYRAKRYGNHWATFRLQ